MLAYTGTIAFLINKDLVKAAPPAGNPCWVATTKVTLGDVGVASQANNGVLAAAYATGGSEKESETRPGSVRQAGQAGPSVAERPDHRQHRERRSGSGVLWDFNALNYRDQIDP